MAKRAAKKKAAGGKKRPVESYDHRDKSRAKSVGKKTSKRKVRKR
jgi:hypothetical protein